MRRSYSGAAKPTTTTADISATATSIPIADATGWPDGASGPFYVTIERGKAGEESMLATARTGLTLTVPLANRGANGTTASSHGSGVAIEHTSAATDFDEANAHLNLLTAKGDLYVRTPTVVARQAAGANSTFLVYDSAQDSGVKAAGLVLPHTHEWAIGGTIAVPAGATNYIPPLHLFVPTGWTAVLSRIRYMIRGGTSVTFKMQKNGSDITGFTALSATTTVATTDPTDVAVVDLDQIAPVVTAVTGSPDNLQVAAEFRLTFAG